MPLRASITHMTDSGPVCPYCLESRAFGYGMAQEPDTVFAQCGSCHGIDYFRVETKPTTAEQFREAHVASMVVRR